jgi:site-specific DNA-methyltransferase (adenine-specific)
MKEIPDKSISLIICDLPYGCLSGQNVNKGLMRMENGIQTGKKAETENGLLQGCSWDIKIDLKAFWEQVKRIRKDDHSATIHFCNTAFGNDLINSNPKEFRYDLVWVKSNAVGFLTANKKPMSSHEMIYIFSKAGAAYNRIDISGNYPAGGGGRRCAKSVIEIPNKKTKGGHPTQKPVEIYKWLIERYSKPGDTILDPTFGSGNSVFTAFEMGRSAIGIEKDEKFYKKAADKLEAS